MVSAVKNKTKNGGFGVPNQAQIDSGLAWLQSHGGPKIQLQPDPNFWASRGKIEIENVEFEWAWPLFSPNADPRDLVISTWLSESAKLEVWQQEDAKLSWSATVWDETGNCHSRLTRKNEPGKIADVIKACRITIKKLAEVMTTPDK